MQSNWGFKAILILVVACLILGATAIFFRMKRRSTSTNNWLSNSSKPNSAYPNQQQQSAFLAQNSTFHFPAITAATTTTYSQFPQQTRQFLLPQLPAQKIRALTYSNSAEGFEANYTYQISQGPFGLPYNLNTIYAQYKKFGNQNGWQLVNAKQMTGFEFFEFKNSTGLELRSSFAQQNANTIEVDVMMIN